MDFLGLIINFCLSLPGKCGVAFCEKQEMGRLDVLRCFCSFLFTNVTEVYSTDDVTWKCVCCLCSDAFLGAFHIPPFSKWQLKDWLYSKCAVTTGAVLGHFRGLVKSGGWAHQRWDGNELLFACVVEVLEGFLSWMLFLTSLSLAALRGEVRAARRDRLHPQRGCARVWEWDRGGGGDQEPQTEDPADAAPGPAPHHPEWLQSLRACAGGGRDDALLELSCSLLPTPVHVLLSVLLL